ESNKIAINQCLALIVFVFSFMLIEQLNDVNDFYERPAMENNPQFITDKDGKRLFAILPYEYYRSLVDGSPSAAHVQSRSLLSEDRKKIILPNGGPGAYIDLIRLADYFQRRGTCDLGISQDDMDMAVNQRAQSLDKFPDDQRDTLDPFVRRHFLPPSSPYRNTMQVTTEVVDALVDTGMFKRIKKKYPYFYRPVNALEVVVPALLEYLQETGPASDPITLFT
ncbi:MAG TPA: hypothetical protein VN089_17535, partial [Duganella sp.]|nr:hypothetical protein [Duganella sp.]